MASFFPKLSAPKHNSFPRIPNLKFQGNIAPLALIESRQKGFDEIADRLEAARGEIWEEYARETFLAHTKNITAKKLRFMQYVKKKDIAWWQKQEKRGALLLGRAAKDL